MWVWLKYRDMHRNHKDHILHNDHLGGEGTGLRKDIHGSSALFIIYLLSLMVDTQVVIIL